MSMKINSLLFFTFFALLLGACNKEEPTELPHGQEDGPVLRVVFVMDSSAARLDNLGDPVTVAAGNAAQHPDFEVLGLHFMGLYADKFTPYDAGQSLFVTPTTEAGGVAAIDFDEELFLTETDNEIQIPLSQVAAGTYEYFRASIGYQKYSVDYNLSGASSSPNWPAGISDDIDVKGTVASFLGYNTYIHQYTIASSVIDVNANKLQGYFGLETEGEVAGYPINEVTLGDAPQTTVPNPINDTSPVPAGSCVVTGKFPTALLIPENPTEDIRIQVVISINNSFEWVDGNGNGKYEPLLGEQVVDMGTRGVFPSVL